MTSIPKYQKSKSTEKCKTPTREQNDVEIDSSIETFTNPNIIEHENDRVTEQNVVACLPNSVVKNHKNYSDIQSKAEALCCALETDLLACDAKWTLFVAAALSYRYDMVLKPFPKPYNQEQRGCNIDALTATINDTPKLSVMLQHITERNCKELSIPVIELLHWVIVVLREPALRLVDPEELNSILKSVNENSIRTRPTHVFEVNTLTGTHSEVAFRQRVANLPIKLAFMGCKFDSYFSLLQNGFTHLADNKSCIELTTDLATSLKQSPSCAAWGASLCGSLIACTAICEFAYDTANDKIQPNQNDRTCVNFQLKNPQNIRVRYLLFYGKRFPKHMQPKSRLLLWLHRHKYPLSLLSYLLFLISMGIANSGSGESFKTYVSKKFDDALELCRRIISREAVFQ